MPHENRSARRHPGFAVLELGAGLGALVVHTDAAMHGVEIEISPDGDDGRRSHKEVLERVAGGPPDYTAVFDRLPEGTYTLWMTGIPRTRGVSVDAGQIAHLDWRMTPLGATG